MRIARSTPAQKPRGAAISRSSGGLAVMHARGPTRLLARAEGGSYGARTSPKGSRVRESSEILAAVLRVVAAGRVRAERRHRSTAAASPRCVGLPDGGVAGVDRRRDAVRSAAEPGGERDRRHRVADQRARRPATMPATDIDTECDVRRAGAPRDRGRSARSGAALFRRGGARRQRDHRPRRSARSRSISTRASFARSRARRHRAASAARPRPCPRNPATG